ncbi:MAG: type II secretion system F family protein [Lachnospiraceae bacterium]
MAGRQFADALNSMAFAVEVGYSVENAVGEAIRDMEMMYGRESVIVTQLEKIRHKTSVNIPIEQAFDELADSINNEDIKYFAHIFSMAERSGGNLISIISNTAKRINKKYEVKAEIETILSAKKMEQQIMAAIPYGIILYLRLTGKEFIVSLYGNVVGVAVMTVCLWVCVAADKIAGHILEIQI